MLSAIKDFFRSELQSSPHETNEQRRNLACAALLLEVAIVDQKLDRSELNTLKRVLTQSFNLSNEQCEKLITLAESQQADATSTYQFTQLVNEFCTDEEKYLLIRGMWSIAYADGSLDKYEEYIIRKVAELIYVSHSQFIRAKLEVRPD
ncbi:TerB family tellurite resistance protein [Teredinibacter turnerae]|uniref:Protein YhgI n=1 Tax=Teredinibacter turnerae (strain ATCC 39867 / T7901) TaxID=377629 RepID=C5BLR9_TERTT|nr:TerB family tellurite resistance protein [Teredinibacter turnerae]ACR13648.1 protein YhgI [Teredinibacter turnerae T7901]